MGVDRDSSRLQFFAQLGYGGGDFAFAGDFHGPLQIFPEGARDDGPWLQRSGGRPADLNEGPVAGEGEGRGAVGQRAAHDEVIVAVDEDAEHGVRACSAEVESDAPLQMEGSQAPSERAG